MSEGLNNNVGDISEADLAALENVLADLELPEDGAEIVEASAEEHLLDADVEAAVESEIERQEIYAGQESTASIEDVPAEPAPVKAKPAKAPKAAKAPKGPVVERDLTKIPVEFFQLSSEDNSVDEDVRAAVITKRPGQKKIAEKFDNLFQALSAGKKPSTFTMDVFAILDAKKEVTSGDLVTALKADDYSDGTARSQVGQMMALFPALGIATRSGQKLTLVENSKLAERLRAL